MNEFLAKVFTLLNWASLVSYDVIYWHLLKAFITF